MKVLLVLFVLYSSLFACKPKRGYTGYLEYCYDKGAKKTQKGWQGTGTVGIIFYSYQYKKHPATGKMSNLVDFTMKIDGNDFVLKQGGWIVGYNKKTYEPYYKEAVFIGKFSDNCNKIDGVWDLGDGRHIDIWMDYNSSYKSVYRH